MDFCKCPRCHRTVGIFKNGNMRPHKVIIDTGRRYSNTFGGIGVGSIGYGDWCKEPKEK